VRWSNRPPGRFVPRRRVFDCRRLDYPEDMEKIMRSLKRLALFLAVWSPLVSGVSSVQGTASAERCAGIPGVSISLGTIRVTSQSIELRCEVRNDSQQDIWVYASGLNGSSIPDRPNARLFMDTDGETLVVLRRMNVPEYGGIDGLPQSATYDLLPPRQSRPEMLSLRLPVSVDASYFPPGFYEALDSDIVIATRLAFEIGCYTSGYLKGPKAQLDPHASIRFIESANQVTVSDLPQAGLWRNERVARITVEGLRIPFRNWIDFEMKCAPPTGQIVKALGRGFIDRLLYPVGRAADYDMCKSGQPPAQALEDLFYDFSIGVTDYRYARRLFRIDESLLDDDGRTIADIYLQLAQGKLKPEELPRSLEKMSFRGFRERVLDDLEARQASADRQRRERIGELLAEAKRCDRSTKRREALTLLRDVLAIDPSHEEAFDLLAEIDAQDKGKVMTNSIGMCLTWIPAGRFRMGKQWSPFCAPAHEVKISRGFYMGMHEVTQAQYRTVMGENPSRSRAEGLPVTDVSWNDAAEFCHKLGLKEGKTFRLPTEAEWEYACRAGTATDYWWGDDSVGHVDAPNPFGLFGMHGGVAEWCRDWFHSAYYVEGPELDPPGPEEPDCAQARIVRGWPPDADSPDLCPAHHRDFEPSGAVRHHIGFRVVLEQDAVNHEQIQGQAFR